MADKKFKYISVQQAYVDPEGAGHPRFVDIDEVLTLRKPLEKEGWDHIYNPVNENAVTAWSSTKKLGDGIVSDDVSGMSEQHLRSLAEAGVFPYEQVKEHLRDAFGVDRRKNDPDYLIEELIRARAGGIEKRPSVPRASDKNQEDEEDDI